MELKIFGTYIAQDFGNESFVVFKVYGYDEKKDVYLCDKYTIEECGVIANLNPTVLPHYQFIIPIPKSVYEHALEMINTAIAKIDTMIANNARKLPEYLESGICYVVTSGHKYSKERLICLLNYVEKRDLEDNPLLLKVRSDDLYANRHVNALIIGMGKVMNLPGYIDRMEIDLDFDFIIYSRMFSDLVEIKTKLVEDLKAHLKRYLNKMGMT